MLFRSEVSSIRKARLFGNVALAVPLSWQAIGYLLLAVLAAVALLGSFASYARVETVSGSIAPDAGVAAMLPSRNGTIVKVAVHEGEYVAAGAELASIRSEEDAAGGRSAAAQVQAAVGQQDDMLELQISSAALVAKAQLLELAAQRKGYSAEITELKAQIALQQQLIEAAQKDLDRTRSIAERGFISQRDLHMREEALIVRQQGLSQLTQSLAGKRTALLEAERSAVQMVAEAAVQHAGLEASRAQVAQQAANAAAARSYVLRAPVAGNVTALTARIGQPANPQVPLMMIIPKGAILRAELRVTSPAIGFVKRGQMVRLAIDSFPYQRFGTVSGQILSIASSAVGGVGPNGSTVPVYPVTVALDRASIHAFGRNEPLVSGMSVTARIITEKQSLFEWLFEPILAVRRR